MREPYRTLLAGYEDHWLLAPYLTADEPDWQAIADDPRIECLSSGEMAILNLAAWFVRNHLALDEPHRVRAAQALLWHP